MKYFKLKDLKRADYNPRKMPEHEMEALVLSIRTHGFVEPIVVNVHPDRYGMIIGGHQRLTAVMRILERTDIKKENPPEGIKGNLDSGSWDIPVFEVKLDLNAEKQLNLALNKIHGKFDDDKLKSIIVSIVDLPTIHSTGFSADEIASILNIPKAAAAEEGQAHICERCADLKKAVAGHESRSGHSINSK